jgi:thioredoxin-related protein
MISRRSLLVAFATSATPGIAQAALRLADDGMYEFDWYLESFLDLTEDVGTAKTSGKRLAIMFGQRACPYCKRMAEEHLATPSIVDYIQAKFEVLHLNLFGAREVSDFDGSKLSERDLARRYNVRLTPTILFMPESAEGLAARPAPQREVARMPGLLEPQPFLAMFRYVQEKRYEQTTFQNWLKTQP